MSEMNDRQESLGEHHGDNPISPVRFPDGVTPDVALEGLSAELPSSTRRRKIALYQAIIGRGHQRILEMGCARGDLSYALLNNAENVVAIDIEASQIELAQRRKALWSLNEQHAKKVSFMVMSAIDLKLPDEAFDWAISTSMIEHLCPQDVMTHLSEVRRVLKPGGKYLVWCPNRLGHHRDRDYHLSMLCYSEWMENLRRAGFRDFRSTLTSQLPLVDARLKVYMERLMWSAGIKILWTHLGVRNVLLVASK